jgi:putative ABC transport system ATP-binding protein
MLKREKIKRDKIKRGKVKRDNTLDSKGGEEMVKGDIILDIKNLTKEYGTHEIKVVALNKVSLHVERGEIIMIVGPSGAGKSTFLQIVGSLLKPTHGEVILEGTNLTDYSGRALSKLRLHKFGFIYQSHNLLAALTAIKNIEVVLNIAGIKGKEAKNKAEELLTKLGLGERLDHKPSELSGGEMQRVAIARALANNPSIILADEPTASLDSETGFKVVQLLRDVAKENKTTVVIVTHDTRIKNLADRILLLSDGKLTFKSSTSGAVIDPVCLMVLPPGKTNYLSEFEGKMYHFCMERCKKEFDKNPSQYLLGIDVDSKGRYKTSESVSEYNIILK